MGYSREFLDGVLWDRIRMNGGFGMGDYYTLLVLCFVYLFLDRIFWMCLRYTFFSYLVLELLGSGHLISVIYS